jgi:hypothetical protein
MEEPIALEETDVGLIGFSAWPQEFKDILMRLYGFLNKCMQSILLSESTRGSHEDQVVYGFAFDLLFVV